MIPKKIKKIYLNDVDENSSDIQNREYIDISQVWHDASEEPKEMGWILIQVGKDLYDTIFIPRDAPDWPSFVKMYSSIHWTYVSNLLPKGGYK